MMNLKGVIFLCVFALCYAKDCSNVKRTNSKLICYYSKLTEVDNCYCTHIVVPANSDVKHIEILKKKINGAKILLTVNEFNEGLINTVKQNHIDGLELNLKKLSTKDDITEFISTVRTKLGNDLFLALSIPPKTELLAKYYDLKALAKTTDLYILQTSFLGASKNVTFHPSRLSGLWDMQNTDSVVDLVTGLGAPLSRLVITAPVQAFQFTLQDDSLTTPGSPALELKSITRKDLCELMKNKEGGSWTLERDQDQAGPYIFRGKEWIAFEDATSMDIKAKYTRVRGVAGLALKDLSQDISKPILNSENSEDVICDSLLTAAHAGLSRQTRAPRQAVLRSLEREILETPASGHLATVHVSPYRITRIVDVEGHVHSVRKDTRTEFECSRQGYFVHPHSCGRFYRCVKFDQLVDEFSVFEFDCPAGLVFDERVEVCVWPGNLPDGAPCHGSSEIAPVPKKRFDCPGKEGYFADPENCRWFFACLDHGKSGLTAYEFRCPFGLVFDEERLLCEWPWLVPTCRSGYISGLELDNIDFYGGAAKSTIIPGNGASKIVNVQLQPQVHVVSSGAHLLDTYDGLGALGTVALGGYNGDLNYLKENINIHSGYEGLGNLAHGVAYLGNQGSSSIEFNKQSQFDSNEHLSLLANAGLDAKYSGGLDYNYQYANEAQYNIQPVVSEINVGVVDKQSNDAVFLNNANLNYNAATSSSYANKLSHNIADISAHQQSVLTALPVEKTVVNHVSVTPKPDFYTLVGGQQKSDGFSTVHHVQQPLITEIKTPVVQKTISSGTSYSSFNQHHTPSIQLEHKIQPIVTEYKSAEIKQNAYSSGYNYQAPAQQLLEVKTPVVQETVVPVAKHQSGYSSTYQYQAPVVHYEQKVQPIVTEVKTPVVQETIIPVAKQQSGYSSSYQYQAPAVQYEQKIQPVVQETIIPVAKQQSGYSSSYHYQAPVVQYEQKIQPVVTEIKTPVVQYEQKVQPIVTEVKTPVVQKTISSGTSYSSFNQHHTPSIQLEQKVQPLVEIKTPVVQQEIQYQTPVVQYEQKVQPLKQTSYSSSYHYQAPEVKYENVQPLVEIKTQPQEVKHSYSSSYQYQTPVVHEQKIHPVVQVEKQTIVPLQEVKSYSSGYQYQAPVQEFKQIVQPVVQKEIVTQAKQTGYSSSYHYQAPVQHYKEVVQPVQEYKEIVQPVVQKQIVTEAKQTGYSSSYHYQAPVQHYKEVVQPVQEYKQIVQPIVTEYKTPLVQKQTGYSSSYQYQAPVQQYKEVVQPVVTEYKTPIAQKEVVTEAKQTGYSSSYHYQAPVQQYREVVQPVQEYKQIVQPVVTEYKTPVVQKQSGYSSSYQYQAPVQQYKEVVQPVVTEYKTPIIQKEIVTEAKQTGYSSSYHYQAPSVQYKEIQPVVTEYKAPVQEFKQVVQPVVTEYKTPIVQKQTGYSSSYHYQAPSVQYKEIQPVVTEYKAPVQEYKQVVQPVVTEYKTPIVQKQTGYSSSYHYQAPVQQYKEVVQPVQEYKQIVQPVVTEYKTPIIQKQIVTESKQTGYSSSYHYQAPSVQYKEVQPVVTEVKTPVVQQTYHYQQPAIKQVEVKAPVVHYEQKIQPVIQQQTYYQAPQVQYEQKQEAKSHSQFYGVQHNVEIKQQPQIIETVSVTPQYDTVSVTPQYVNHQYYDKKVHEVKLPVVEKPISYEGRVPVQEEKIVPVKAYQTYTSHHAKVVTEAPGVYKAPEVYVSTTPKYAVFQEYIQPKQTFEIKKKVIPVTPKYETYSVQQPQQIVETYNYQPQIKQEIIYTTPKPKAYLPPKAPQVYVSTTPKYIETVEVKKPASPTIISQYEYVNPEYANYESKLNLNFDHFNTEPTNAPVEQYHTQTAFYSTQDQKQVIPVEKYQTEFVVSTPKPTFISTIAPVLKQTPTARTKIVAINKYKTYDDQYYVSTPKQFYVSTPAPVVKTEDSLPPFRYYDSRLDTATKQAYYDDYIVQTEAPKIVSTVRPVVTRKKIASTTTPIPLDIYEDYADVNYGSQYLVEVKPSTYKPKVKQYLVSSTTETPLNFYYEDKVKSTVRPVARKKIVSTTTERYEESTYKSTSRPIVKKKKIVTTTTAAPIEVAYDYDEYYVSSEKPKYESVKITPRPKAKGKTVVRVNDFHPFLTTKLGAQCTCVSNTVKLRKGSKQQEVEEYDYELPENVPVTKLTKSGPAAFNDYEEPGVYVVGNSDVTNADFGDEDYEYELKKVTVTKTPEVIIKSTTNAAQPAPTPEYTHRRRITTARPSIEVTSSKYASRTSTTRIEEVFLSSTEAPKRYRTKSKEQKIVEAVNEGLSLVKSTVKSAVKEAIAEENRNFDRYGPGGWRSRGETLQGSVDCKREGLFRHPTQCNKFYACRWDCTKQRYTLHVFNCPVHLTFDTSQGACNWPSKGPACTGNTLLPSS